MNELKESYNIITSVRAVFLGRVVFLFMLFTLPFFIYMDFFLLKLNTEIVYLRVLPILTGFIFFITSFIFKKRTGHFFIILYAVLLISTIIMMLGLVSLVLHTQLFHDSIIALIIVILLAAIVSVRGMIFLIPVYGIPFAGFFAFIIISGKTEITDIVALSNPVILSAGFIVLAEITERSRFKNFISARTIEIQTDELLEKNRIIEEKNLIFEKELSLARLVQKNLLPVSAPSFSSLKTAAIFTPMREVGGDLYDFVQFNNNEKLGIFISDISGHGMSAAIISSMVKTLIVTAGLKRLIPSELLLYLNNNLKGMISDNFLTAFYGIYDPKSHAFTYARGGHEYPLHISSDGIPLPLKSKGKLLGVTYDTQFEDCTVLLSKGDKVLFYTDGLTEAMNDAGVMFEKKMIENIIPSIASEPVDIFVSRLYSEVNSFKKHQPFEDDICILGFEIIE